MCHVSLGWLQSAPLSSYNRLHATGGTTRLNDSGRFFSQLMDPLEAGRDQELFSAYLRMINQINSVDSVQGLCHKNTQLSSSELAFWWAGWTGRPRTFHSLAWATGTQIQDNVKMPGNILPGWYRGFLYPKLTGHHQCTDNLSILNTKWNHGCRSTTCKHSPYVAG